MNIVFTKLIVHTKFHFLFIYII